MKKAIELKNITLKYHTPTAETLAVKDVNFDIFENEFLTIVGPSGCGKSTVLSMISGLLKPTFGNMKIFGCENLGNKKVGYMLQRDYLFEWRTIEKNIILGLEIQKKLTSETKNYAVNLAKKYGLENFLNHYPNQLSGGMRQKAALIRTLAVRPEILLLDEPFSALDYQTRILISGEVLEIIKAEKKTALLISHDISEAISVSDRVLIFSHRPGTVRKSLKIDFGEKALSVAEKRKHKKFNEYFEIIWNEMTG